MQRIFLIIVSTLGLPVSISWGDLEELGSIVGDYQDVVVGDYAYCLGDSALKIIDISDPTHPIIVGNLPLSSTIGVDWNLFIKQNYAYIANGDLQIVDISHPTNPVLILSQAVIWTTRDIYVDSIYAYIVGYLVVPPYTNNGILEILDISTPSAPSVVGSLIIEDRQFSTIYGKENYVYIGTQAWGPTPLYAVEVTNPSAPQVTDTLDGFIVMDDIHVENNYAYIVTHNGFHIVNISNPFDLTFVQSLPLLSGSSIFVENPYVYIAAMNKGLKIVDISDCQNPLVVDSASTLGVSCAVYKNNKYIYLADGNAGGTGNGGFRIFRFTSGVKEREFSSSETCFYQNYPNPFEGKTIIRYTFPSRVKPFYFLKIYNVAGKLVRTVELKEKGGGTFCWNGTNEEGGKVSSGIYFYQFYSVDKSFIEDFGKMLKMK